MTLKAAVKEQASEREHELAVLLKVLADENRLKILNCLATGEKCVCQLTNNIKISQNLMSHHLRVLKDANLVQDQRRGRWIYYSNKPAGFKKILGRMENFCDCSSNKC